MEFAKEYRVVLVTVDSPETAKTIAHALVEGHHAACVNLIPSIRSIYRWGNSICDDTETLLLIKTRKGCLGELEKQLKSLHPYDVPEMLALTVEEGFGPYLQWLGKETVGEGEMK